MRVWRRKARGTKKAKPLAFETLKALRVPARSAGEAEAMRPALKPKSFASKVASIITRLKPTPEELAEVRKIARKVTRRGSSNRKGRRPRAHPKPLLYGFVFAGDSVFGCGAPGSQRSVHGAAGGGPSGT